MAAIAESTMRRLCFGGIVCDAAYGFIERELRALRRKRRRLAASKSYSAFIATSLRHASWTRSTSGRTDAGPRMHRPTAGRMRRCLDPIETLDICRLSTVPRPPPHMSRNRRRC